METDAGATGTPLCPSAQPQMEGSIAFGVVGGTAQEPRLAHLVRPMIVTETANPSELLAQAAGRVVSTLHELT